MGQSLFSKRLSGLVIALVCALVSALAMTGCQQQRRPYDRFGNGQPPDVGVELFQWTWPAIAAECPTLAKLGYTYVQTSPPQESVVGGSWKAAYQPVSYKLESSYGTRAELEDMIVACHRVHVDVYVDAVINNMAGVASGVGTGGTTFTHDNYPGLYSSDDFHHCGLTPGDDIVDHTNPTQVQDCESDNRADLFTSRPEVQQRIAAYLSDLRSLGVDGFRIIDAQSIPALDLNAIRTVMDEGRGAGRWILSVATESPDIKPHDYSYLGSPEDDSLAEALKVGFAGPDPTTLNLARPESPTGSSTFVSTYRTERSGDSLSVADPKPYLWAEIFLLGTNWGLPVIHSGYDFGGDADAGPPRLKTKNGQVKAASCDPEAKPWTCHHRNPALAGMATFRQSIGDADLDVIVRVDQVNIRRVIRTSAVGFVTINTSDQTVLPDEDTEMYPGTYCNLLVPDCAEQITVNDDGHIATPLAAGEAVAIASGQKPSSTP